MKTSLLLLRLSFKNKIIIYVYDKENKIKQQQQSAAGSHVNNFNRNLRPFFSLLLLFLRKPSKSHSVSQVETSNPYSNQLYCFPITIHISFTFHLMMQISAVLPDVPVVLPSAGSCRPPEGKHCGSFLDAKYFLSHGLTRVSFLSILLFRARGRILSFYLLLVLFFFFIIIFIVMIMDFFLSFIFYVWVADISLEIFQEP